MRLVDAWNQSTRALKACSVLILAIFVPWMMLALLALGFSYLLGADPDLLRDESSLAGLLVGLNALSILLFIVGSLTIKLPTIAKTTDHSLSPGSHLKAQKA